MDYSAANIPPLDLLFRYRFADNFFSLCFGFLSLLKYELKKKIFFASLCFIQTLLNLKIQIFLSFPRLLIAVYDFNASEWKKTRLYLFFIKLLFAKHIKELRNNLWKLNWDFENIKWKIWNEKKNFSCLWINNSVSQNLV